MAPTYELYLSLIAISQKKHLNSAKKMNRNRVAGNPIVTLVEWYWAIRMTQYHLIGQSLHCYRLKKNWLNLSLACGNSLMITTSYPLHIQYVFFEICLKNHIIHLPDRALEQLLGTDQYSNQLAQRKVSKDSVCLEDGCYRWNGFRNRENVPICIVSFWHFNILISLSSTTTLSQLVKTFTFQWLQ